MNTIKTVEIGITQEHCGHRCTPQCAALAIEAVNAANIRGVRAVAGSRGPWDVEPWQHDAIEDAMDRAEHRCRG